MKRLNPERDKIVIKINESEVEYQKNENEISFSINVKTKESCQIEVIYPNDNLTQNVDISKKNLRINLLRYLSDIRDNYIATNPIGKGIVKYYYQSGIYKLGLMNIFIAAAIISIFSTSIVVLKKMKDKV